MWNEDRHKVAQPNGDDVLVGPDWRANARLIAAAPDLLAAAEAAEPHICGQNSARALVIIRAAIARARGEE